MAFVTANFGYTGDWQQFAVPPSVHTVYIVLFGGGAQSAVGGRVEGSLKVSPQDVLWIAVGSKGLAASGHNGGPGRWPNGGDGADGHTGRNGGGAGGGASYIRRNRPDGDLLAVAGGAGGDSGDAGAGGVGGGLSAADGHRADASANPARGGGQVHGGNGGRIPSDQAFNGHDATDTIVGFGGAGGRAANDKCHGGGGGGGGFHSGGGGQGGKNSVWFGGGGGGGSSLVGPMDDVTFNTQTATVDQGLVIIGWFQGGDLPPTVPGDVKINGEDETAGMALGANDVHISGVPHDPQGEATIHMLLFLSTSKIEGAGVPAGLFNWPSVHGAGGRSYIDLNGTANTHYYGRLYSQDGRGQLSEGYVGIDFWTDRPPSPPVLTDPSNDTEFETTDTITFEWTVDDPDSGAISPDSSLLQWRRAATAFAAAGEWNYISIPAAGLSADVAASGFPPGAVIEWQVQSTYHSLTSEWSKSGTFFVTPIAVPPEPTAPVKGIALYASEAALFSWQFRTLLVDETQTNADIRWRLAGQDDDDWVVITGGGIEPGGTGQWLIAAETFPEGYAIEWQVRTHTSNATTSAYSETSYFWSIRTPGLAVDPIPLDQTRLKEALGVGINRVYLYRRGGLVPLGELTPIKDVQWSRKRDDLGQILIHVNQWNDDSVGLLRQVKTWATELVVFRQTPAGNERVAEGPVVRIEDSANGLEIEAKDVMGYVYRRLLRVGYNDAYQLDKYGNQLGMHTVVHRAERIIANALAYDDPNVLPYLTSIHHFDDAIQARIVKAYSKGAWEDVDDMAANAGLDYSVIGRRIILNDTHRPIGRLLELSNGDFSQPPVVTEYGMTYATDFAVTNNNGLYGIATRGRDVNVPPQLTVLTGDAADTGYVEQLASQYGESGDEGVGQEDLTPEQVAAIQTVLNAQAERNIAGRYPIPVIVRVPDNANLLPSCPLGINQLVPGVWVPLRAKGLILEASQWQKLDSVTCLQNSDGEKISVVLSPAPNRGADPDADIDPGV